MYSLYCKMCGNYLMYGTGDCVDCQVCGWKQEVDVVVEEDVKNENQ